MMKLIRAGFARLWKNKVFWGSILILCLITGMRVMENYNYSSLFTGDEALPFTPDATIFPAPAVVMVLLAIFVDSFVGTEFGDKTIRNKIIAGHSRSAIYASDLIVCIAAAMIVYLAAFALVGVGMGALLMGSFKLSAKAYILPVLSNLCAVAAMVSVFVLVAMLGSGRRMGTVIVMVAALLLLVAPFILGNALEAPEYIQALGYVDDAGNIVETGEMIKNPAYISGFARDVLQLIYNMLPMGQLDSMDPLNLPSQLALFPLYSLLMSAVTTAAGVFFFRRKDIK